MKIKNTYVPGIKYMIKRILERAEPVSKQYHISKLWIFIDYIFCGLRYGCKGLEYFSYKFYLLNRHGKRRFMTDVIGEKYENAHINHEFRKNIDDKEKAFIKFGDYMKRDWCGQECHNTREEYEAFAEKHSRCIAKPRNDYGGHGIRIIPTTEIDGKNLFDYCAENDLMIEELVCQHDELNRMYDKAVNTIRIMTSNGKLIGATLRMGVGGSEVDNASSGGIYAEIDTETGVVISRAYQHTGRQYTRHPYSGTIIPGFAIPFWDKCIKMIEEANGLIEGIPFVGWDVAITNDGPTLIEVNSNPGYMVMQAPGNHGIRDKLMEAAAQK